LRDNDRRENIQTQPCTTNGVPSLAHRLTTRFFGQNGKSGKNRITVIFNNCLTRRQVSATVAFVVELTRANRNPNNQTLTNMQDILGEPTGLFC
jgi:hypothetical protein